MAYPHKWSPISYKSSAGQRKDTGQRPMLYRWTTQPPTKYWHVVRLIWGRARCVLCCTEYSCSAADSAHHI